MCLEFMKEPLAGNRAPPIIEVQFSTDGIEGCIRGRTSGTCVFCGTPEPETRTRASQPRKQQAPPLQTGGPANSGNFRKFPEIFFVGIRKANSGLSKLF